MIGSCTSRMIEYLRPLLLAASGGDAVAHRKLSEKAAGARFG